jgi:hypothetical protein
MMLQMNTMHKPYLTLLLNPERNPRNQSVTTHQADNKRNRKYFVATFPNYLFYGFPYEKSEFGTAVDVYKT